MAEEWSVGNAELLPSLAIIDDDQGILEGLGEWATRRGFRCSLFGSAEQFRASLKDDVNHELVLCDVQLPDAHGLDLLREGKLSRPWETVILMSAFTNIRDAVQGIREGAFDYIEKPLDLTRLEIILQNALRISFLRKSQKSSLKLGGVPCPSSSMQLVYDLVGKISAMDSNVLVTGESGVGKEIIARAIHANSPRASAPWVAVNCSAIPENLLESELFGHAKGAFTHAVADRDGLFVEADKGVLFLDEVGDLALPLQAKILRVIQEREVRPVGKNLPRKIDVRIVAATHRNLKKAIESGTFREDLYYRLNVVNLKIPPLRDRPEDILALAHHHLKTLCEKYRITGQKNFSPRALEFLTQLPLYGNVRELQNLIERALVFSKNNLIQATDLQEESLQERPTPIPGKYQVSLKDLEQDHIQKVLAKNQGNVGPAAQELGVSPRTLYRKIADYKNQRIES